MNQVNFKINSGKRKLILSETVCFNPLDGIRVLMPTYDESMKLNENLIFNFSFSYNESDKNGKYETSVDGKNINIAIQNFGSSLLSGTINPLVFHIGKQSISLFFTGFLLANNEDKNSKLLQFTFSIFMEGEK